MRQMRRRLLGWALLACVGVGCRSEAPSAPVVVADAGPDAPAFEHPPVDEAALERLDARFGPRSPEEEAQRREEAERVRRERTQRRMERLPALVARYREEAKPPALPSSLWELSEPPDGRAPYATPDQLRDGWGNELILEAVEGGSYRLRSVGPDDRYGSGDDMILSP